MSQKIVIGTRASPLALAQTNWVAHRLQEIWSGEVEILPLKTIGDRIQDVPLTKIGRKGIFVKRIELALLEGQVDLAVHSMKDLPTCLPKGLCLAAIPPRLDPRDALISKDNCKLEDLPSASQIGTSSLRRQAQLLHAHPNLEIVPLRGNLQTRLRKLENSNLAAIVVAIAGLLRLNLTHHITQILEPDICLPAVGQGALALEARTKDQRLLQILKSLDDLPSRRCVEAERSFSRVLRGGCQVPLGALAQHQSGSLTLLGVVCSMNGERLVRGYLQAPLNEAEDLGKRLAEKFLSQGAREILEEIRGAS